ncbi:hypothetical protein NYF23_06745 [SAR92 clade bacterium H455]|uniref:HYR domain-containing protein n=1 Tax=SAR92 clade bacterium H455 TaxID=2974818 RepID=A0ABY5TVW2_9GAMM|nr:hypothetical protein NYF23_06745 [SAR92 clade bacterium H455]
MLRLIGCFAFLLTMSGFVSAQNQTVTGALSQSSVSAGDSVTLTVSYQATNDDLTTGLGLRVHYDSSKLVAGDVADLLTSGQAGNQFQDDSSDLDNDSATDKFFTTNWADPFSGAWPSGVNLPATLFSLPFTAQSGFTATTINFSKSSNAAGYTFVGESVVVTEALTVAVTSAPLINTANNSSYAVSGTCNRDDVAVIVELSIGSGSVSSASVDCNDGVWASSGIDASTLDEGTITVAASASVGSEQASASQEIRKDITGPAITAPASISVAATDASGTLASTDEITAYLAAATGLDNSDSSVVITSDAASVFPLGATTVVFSAVDSAGNLGASSSVVTVTDQTAPVITTPDSVAVAALDASGTAASDAAILGFIASASATDNVDVNVTISDNAPAQLPLGPTIVVFTATDAAGNSSTGSVTITVADQTGPAVTVPTALVIAAGDATGTAATNSAIVAFLSAASAEDNVDDVLSLSNDAPDQFPLGATVVMFSATDAAGNLNTATSTVTVTDQAGPVLSAPAAITVAAADALGTPTTDSAVVAFLAAATAADNVDSTVTIENDAASTLVLGANLVTFTAVDAAGNDAIAVTSTITVVDQTGPVVTAPASLTVAAVDATGTPASAAAILSFIANALAEDNVDADVSVTSDAPAQFTLGATTVTFTASDAAGNSTTASAVITVVDQTAPVVTAPANASIAAVDATGTAATETTLAALLAMAFVEDNVDAALTLTNDAPEQFPLGATVVVFSATDSADNSHTASTTVTVTDQAVPVLTAPESITVAAVDASGTPVSNAAVESFLASVSSIDNVDSTVAVANNAPSTLVLGANLITFTAVDAAGNAAVAVTSTVTVTDQTAPVINVPATLTVLGTSEGVSGSLEAITALIASVSASDNVDGAITAISNNAPALFPFGTTQLTFTATDAAGNKGTAATAVIVSLDVVVPELTVPGSITINVDMPGDVVVATASSLTDFFAALSAMDNKDGDISANITDDRPGEFAIGDTVVTFTVADAASNTTTKSATVSVVVLDTDADGLPDFYETAKGLDPNNADDASADLDGDGISNADEYAAGSDPAKDELPPVLTIPDDVIVSATGLMTTVDVGQASAADNKDGALTPTASLLESTLKSGLYSNTWSVEDAAGNAVSAVQTIKVLPLVSLTPSSVTTEGSQVEVSFILSGDAADYPVTIPFTVSGTASLSDDFSVASETLVITEGSSGTVVVDIVADAESEVSETIVITLGEPINAVLGAVVERTVTVVEENLAPQLRFAVMQNQQPGRIVAADSGLVTVTANYTDQNAADTHTFEWNANASDLAGVSITDQVLTFDPSTMSAGTLSVAATVTDSGSPLLSASKSVVIKVLAAQLVLDAALDTDGDGIFDAEEGLDDSDGDGIPDYQDNIAESYLAPVGGDSTQVMQAPAGTTIALGDSVFSAGSNSVGLSEEQLVVVTGSADDDYDYPSGLFDFTVSGAAPGESYNLVLPLASGIPANSVFRKFIDENIGWQDFVVDATNAISSAAASNGACPEPGSALYASGLTIGDSCIQLFIEDGGPNDTDGVADGTVTDPSGLATLYFGPPSSGSSIALSATELNAGASTAATVTVTAVDSDGRQLEGMTVTATASVADVTVGSFTDQGEGVYTATLTPGNTGGSVKVTATISDGVDSTTVTSAALTINKSSGGGGCTVAVNQSPDMSLLLVMFIGLALFFRRRLLKL